jgi:cytochrome c553
MWKHSVAFAIPLLIASLHLQAAELQVDDGQLKEADLATREQLSQRLAEITSDPAKHEEALYYGELRSTLCKTCHGPDGNADKEGMPSLAGQNPVYIVDQFNRYADGRRLNHWMSALSQSFKDDDKIKLAIYYSQQEMKPAKGGNPALLERGEEIYRAWCIECHGENGRAKEGYANLAGQRPEYTAKMLKEFKTATGKRFNPWMYGRANLLKTDTDIEAVATYLAHLE